MSEDLERLAAGLLLAKLDDITRRLELLEQAVDGLAVLEQERQADAARAEEKPHK